jgi:hypothetical protein
VPAKCSFDISNFAMTMKQNTPGFFPAKVPGFFVGSNIDF